MDIAQQQTLAELSNRLWVRIAADLVNEEAGQPPGTGPMRKPQMTPAIAIGMSRFYAISREQFNEIDIEIDHLLHLQVKRDPLDMKAVEMQKAARSIHDYLYREHDLSMPIYVIYGMLREEVDAMRAKSGQINLIPH